MANTLGCESAATARASVSKRMRRSGSWAKADGIVPVADPAQHDTVIALERAGYKLGSRVIRPARVLVGRLVS